jgi:hypothetical protein
MGSGPGGPVGAHLAGHLAGCANPIGSGPGGPVGPHLAGHLAGRATPIPPPA